MFEEFMNVMTLLILLPVMWLMLLFVFPRLMAMLYGATTFLSACVIIYVFFFT